MPLPERHPDRVLLLDGAARVVDPGRPGMTEYWPTPGGGLEPGESHEQCALRELREELGVEGVRICGAVSTLAQAAALPRRVDAAGGAVDGGAASPHEPGSTDVAALGGLTGDVRRWIREARWWTLEDMLKCALPIMTPPLGELVRAAKDLRNPGQSAGQHTRRLQ